MDSATENDSHFAIASGGEAEIMQVGDENPDTQIRAQNSHLQNRSLDCRLQGNRRGERGYVHIIFVLFTILGVALWGVSESLRDATKTQLNIEKKSVANLQRARRAIINYVAIPPGPRPDTLPGGDFVNFYDDNNTPTNLNDDRRQVFTEFLLPCPDNLGFSLNAQNFIGSDGFAPDRNPDQGTRDDLRDNDFDGSADFNPRNTGNPVGFCGDQTTSINDVTRGVMRDGSRFGRLPWREVDLGAMRYVRGLGGVDYRDGYDGRLWYALSLNNTRTFSKALQRRGGVNSIAPLNPHRLLRLYEDWLVVRDLYGNVISDRVAAVVLSPGANFGQSRPFETFYPWFPAGSPTGGGSFDFRGPHYFGPDSSVNDASRYFEEGNENADGVFFTPHAIFESSNASIDDLSAYRRTASEDQLAFVTAEDLAAPGSEPIRILEDENSPRHIYSRLDGEQFGQTGIVQILEGFFARNGFLPDPAMFIEAHGESLVRNIPVRRARVLQPGEINAITVSGARVGGASQTFNSPSELLEFAVINVDSNPVPVTLTIRHPAEVTATLSLSYSAINPAGTTILLLTVYAKTGANPAVAPLTVVEVDLDASGVGNGLVPLATFPQRIFAAGREVELFDESLAPELPRLILSSARLPPVYLASRIDTEGIQAEGIAESNVPFNIIAVNLENSLHNQTLPAYDSPPPDDVCASLAPARRRPIGSPAASFTESCELPPGEVATATNIQLLVERTHYVQVLPGSYTVRLAAPAAVPLEVPSRDIEFQDGSSDPTAARGGAGVLLPEGTLLTFTVGAGEEISLQIPAGFRVNDAGPVSGGNNQDCLSPGANVPRRCSLPFGPAPFEFVFDVSRERIIDGNPVVLPGIDFEINQVPAANPLQDGIQNVVENAAAVPGQVGFLPVTSLDAEAARLNIDITRYPLTHRISLAAGGIGYFPTSVRISTPSGQNAPIIQPHYPGDWTVPRPGAVTDENSIFPRSRNNLAWATEMQLEGGEITLPPETRFVIPQSTGNADSFVDLGTDFSLPPGAIAFLPPDFILPSVRIASGGRLPDGSNVPAGVQTTTNVFLPLGAAMVFPRGGDLARGIFFPSAGQAGFQLEVARNSRIFNGNNPVGTVTEDGSLFYPFRGEELRPTAITIAALPDPPLNSNVNSSQTSELVSFSWTRGGLLAAPQRYRWRGLNIGSGVDWGRVDGRDDNFADCEGFDPGGPIDPIFLFCIQFLQRSLSNDDTGSPEFTAPRPFVYHDLGYRSGEVGLNTRVTAAIGTGGALTITLNEGFRFLLPPGATVTVQRAHAAVTVVHDNLETSLQGEGDFGYRQYICRGGVTTCGLLMSPQNYPANLMAFVQNRNEFALTVQQHGFAAVDDVVREDAVNQVVLPAGTAVYPPGQAGGDGSAPPFPILSAPLTVTLLHTVSLENEGRVIRTGIPRETRGAGSLQSQMVLWPDSDMLYRANAGSPPETAIPGGSLINLTQGRATPPLGRAKIRAFAEDGGISYGGPMIGFVQRDTSLAINDAVDRLAPLGCQVNPPPPPPPPACRELRAGFYTISDQGRPVRVWRVNGARPVEETHARDVPGGVTVHYPRIFTNSPLKLPKGAIVYVPGGRELAVLMTSHDTGNFPANSDRSVIPTGSYAYIPRGTIITITAVSGQLNATANGDNFNYSTNGRVVPGPAVVDLANFAFRGLPYVADEVGGNVRIVGRGDLSDAIAQDRNEVFDIRGADPEWNPSNIEFFAHAPGAAIRNNRAVRLLRANQDFDVLGNAVYRGENTFFTEQLPPALGTFAENYPLVYAVAGECRRFNNPSPDCAQGANEGLLLTLRARATVSLPEDYAVPGNTLIRAETGGAITLTINYPAVDVTQGLLSGRIGRRTEILEVNWLAFGNDGSGLAELTDGTTRQINTAGAEPISVVVPPPTGGRLEVAIGLPGSAVVNSPVVIIAEINVNGTDIATTATIAAALTSVDDSAISDSVPRAYPSILSGGVRVGVPVTVNIGGFTGDNRINDQCLQDRTGRGASCPAHPLIIPPAVGFSVGAGTRLESTDTPGIFGVGGVYSPEHNVTIVLDDYALVNARSAAYGLTAAANIVTFAADGAPGAVAAGQVLEVDLSADRGGFMLDMDCTGDGECTSITMTPGYTWEGFIQGVATLGYNTKPNADGSGAEHPLEDQATTITVGTSSESSWAFRQEFFARQYPDDLELGFGGHGTVTTTIQVGGGAITNIATETPAQMVGTLQVAVCTSLALDRGDCPGLGTAASVTITVRHQGGFSFVRHFPGPGPGFEPMTATVSNYGFCSQNTDDGNSNYGTLDDCYHPTFNQRLNVLDGGGESTNIVPIVRLQNSVIPVSDDDAPHYLADINVADGTGRLTLSAFFEGNSECSDALLPVATVAISVAVTVTIGDQPPRETDSVYATLAVDANADEHSFVVADAQIVLDRTYSPTLATGENLQVLVPGRSFNKFEGYAAIYQPIGSSVDVRRNPNGTPTTSPFGRSIASRVRSAAWRDFFGGDLTDANDSGFTQAEAQRASYAVEAGYFHILNPPDDDSYGVFFMVPEPVINVVRARRDDSATFVVGSGDTNTTIPSLPPLFTNARPPAYLPRSAILPVRRNYYRTGDLAPRPDGTIFQVQDGDRNTTIPAGLPNSGDQAFFPPSASDAVRENYYLQGDTAPDPDGAISENVEIYAGSIINMRTGQVIPSRRLVDGSVVLGQEGARVGINGGNARVPLPIVDTIEDIVPLTQNTQGSIFPSSPQGILATIDASPTNVDPTPFPVTGNSDPLRDVCKIWIFPELEDVETNLQEQFDIQVETAFFDLVKRWAGPATEQIPTENLARMVNAADPPLTLRIDLVRNVALDSGVQVEAGAPVDFEFVINRQTRRDGGNFNAVNFYDVFRLTTGGPPLTLPKSGSQLTISVLTGQTEITLQHRRRSTGPSEPNPPVDIIYTLTEGPMNPNMMHMVDTTTVTTNVRRQFDDARDISEVNHEQVTNSDFIQRLVTPYVFTVRIDRRPRGLLVVGGDKTGYRLSEWGAGENPDAGVFRGDGRALYIPYLRPADPSAIPPELPPAARMTIRYVSDQPTFGNRSLSFQLDRHCSLGNEQSDGEFMPPIPPGSLTLVRFFDRTTGTETDRTEEARQSMFCLGNGDTPSNFSTNIIEVTPRTARDSGQFDDHAIIVHRKNFYGTGDVTVTLYTVAEFVVENTYNIAHIEDPTPYYPPVIRFRRVCAGTENANGLCADTAADTYLRDVNGGLNFFANVDRHGGALSSNDRARTASGVRGVNAIVYRNLSVEICPLGRTNFCAYGNDRSPFFVEEIGSRGSAKIKPPENTCDFLIPNADGTDRIISVPAPADNDCSKVSPNPDQFFNAAEVLADDSAVSGETHTPDDSGVRLRVAANVSVNFPLTAAFTVAIPTPHAINAGSTSNHFLLVSLYTFYNDGQECPLTGAIRHPSNLNSGNAIFRVAEGGGRNRCGLDGNAVPINSQNSLEIPVTASAYTILPGLRSEATLFFQLIANRFPGSIGNWSVASGVVQTIFVIAPPLVPTITGVTNNRITVTAGIFFNNPAGAPRIAQVRDIPSPVTISARATFTPAIGAEGTCPVLVIERLTGGGTPSFQDSADLPQSSCSITTDIVIPTGASDIRLNPGAARIGTGEVQLIIPNGADGNPVVQLSGVANPPPPVQFRILEQRYPGAPVFRTDRMNGGGDRGIYPPLVATNYVTVGRFDPPISQGNVSLALRVVEIPPNGFVVPTIDVNGNITGGCSWDGDVYFPPVNGQSMTTFGPLVQDTSINPEECYATGSIPINLGAAMASIYVAGVNGVLGGRNFRVEVLESNPGNQYTLPDDSTLNQKLIFYADEAQSPPTGRPAVASGMVFRPVRGLGDPNSLPFPNPLSPARAEWSYAGSGGTGIVPGHSQIVTLVYQGGPNPAREYQLTINGRGVTVSDANPEVLIPVRDGDTSMTFRIDRPVANINPVNGTAVFRINRPVGSADIFFPFDFSPIPSSDPGVDISIVISGVQPLGLSGLANVQLVGGGSEPPVTVAVNNRFADLPVVATLNARPSNALLPPTPIPIRVGIRAPVIDGNCPLVGWVYHSGRFVRETVTFTTGDISNDGTSCEVPVSAALPANIISQDQEFPLLPIVNAVSTVTLSFAGRNDTGNPNRSYTVNPLQSETAIAVVPDAPIVSLVTTPLTVTVDVTLTVENDLPVPATFNPQPNLGGVLVGQPLSNQLDLVFSLRANPLAGGICPISGYYAAVTDTNSFSIPQPVTVFTYTATPAQMTACEIANIRLSNGRGRREMRFAPIFDIGDQSAVATFVSNPSAYRLAGSRQVIFNSHLPVVTVVAPGNVDLIAGEAMVDVIRIPVVGGRALARPIMLIRAFERDADVCDATIMMGDVVADSFQITANEFRECIYTARLAVRMFSANVDFGVVSPRPANLMFTIQPQPNVLEVQGTGIFQVNIGAPTLPPEEGIGTGAGAVLASQPNLIQLNRRNFPATVLLAFTTLPNRPQSLSNIRVGPLPGDSPNTVDNNQLRPQINDDFIASVNGVQVAATSGAASYNIDRLNTHVTVIFSNPNTADTLTSGRVQIEISEVPLHFALAPGTSSPLITINVDIIGEQPQAQQRRDAQVAWFANGYRVDPDNANFVLSKMNQELSLAIRSMDSFRRPVVVGRPVTVTMAFEGDANTDNYSGTSPFDGGDYSTATSLSVLIERDASESSWVLVAADDTDDAALTVELLPPDPIPPPEGNNEETVIIGEMTITIEFDDDNPTPRASQAIPFPYDSDLTTTISISSTGMRIYALNTQLTQEVVVRLDRVGAVDPPALNFLAAVHGAGLTLAINGINATFTTPPTLLPEVTLPVGTRALTLEMAVAFNVETQSFAYDLVPADSNALEFVPGQAHAEFRVLNTLVEFGFLQRDLTIYQNAGTVPIEIYKNRISSNRITVMITCQVTASPANCASFPNVNFDPSSTLTITIASFTPPHSVGGAIRLSIGTTTPNVNLIAGFSETNIVFSPVDEGSTPNVPTGRLPSFAELIGMPNVTVTASVPGQLTAHIAPTIAPTVTLLIESDGIVGWDTNLFEGWVIDGIGAANAVVPDNPLTGVNMRSARYIHQMVLSGGHTIIIRGADSDPPPAGNLPLPVDAQTQLAADNLPQYVLNGPTVIGANLASGADGQDRFDGLLSALGSGGVSLTVTEYHLRGITQRDRWQQIGGPFEISSGTIYTSTGTEMATIQMTVSRENVHRLIDDIPERTIEATTGMVTLTNQPTQVVLMQGVLSTMVAPDFMTADPEAIWVRTADSATPSGSFNNLMPHAPINARESGAILQDAIGTDGCIDGVIDLIRLICNQSPIPSGQVDRSVVVTRTRDGTDMQFTLSVYPAGVIITVAQAAFSSPVGASAPVLVQARGNLAGGDETNITAPLDIATNSDGNFDLRRLAEAAVPYLLTTRPHTYTPVPTAGNSSPSEVTTFPLFSSVTVRQNVWIRLLGEGATYSPANGSSLDLAPGGMINPIMGTYLDPASIGGGSFAGAVVPVQTPAQARRELRLAPPALQLPKGTEIRLGERGAQFTNVQAAVFFSLTPLERTECAITDQSALNDSDCPYNPGNSSCFISQTREDAFNPNRPLQGVENEHRAQEPITTGHPCAYLDTQENTDNDHVFELFAEDLEIGAGSLIDRVVRNDRARLLGGRFRLCHDTGLPAPEDSTCPRQ